jgi:putative transposase
VKRHKRFLKTFLLETILNTPGHVVLDRMDVWFQDEARFGQHNTTIQQHGYGQRKVPDLEQAVRQQQFEYAYLFGAVCPVTHIPYFFKKT